MRKDGYSSSYIHVVLGIAVRKHVSAVIKEAGIIDTAIKADERYPLRCAKCKEHGHNASECSIGDALDQLDAEQTHYKQQRKAALSLKQFEQIKIALHHQLDSDTIAREMRVELKEVTKAELARTYEEYCAK